ncbi:MAG: hypothetical protein ACMVO5_05080 [Polymorphobacter sp.]|uniref:hypothetical protein n=1 Tax=Polymorphobacter sp. TaxID=1909290 RepID=UPI003A87552A
MRRALLVAVLLANPAAAHAQESGWRFLVQPYLLLPSMDGKAAVAGIDANVDVGARDIVSNLNIGFLGYVEAGKGDLSFGVDVNYMNLDANPDDARVSANVSQTAVQPILFYRVADYFELMGGLRYNRINLGLSSDIAAIDGREQTKDWVDPILGFRFNGPLSKTTSFGVLANVGGFGVGSDIAVQVRPMLNFAVGSGITLDAGYQFVYMDYETGTGTNRFAYDVLTTGPILGLTFRF